MDARVPRRLGEDWGSPTTIPSPLIVLAGERCIPELRKPSSSNALERFEAGLLIAIGDGGWGDFLLETVRLKACCARLGLEVDALDRGIVAVGGDSTLGLAEIDTAEVCGSLGPLRNGLNNQEGVSFELRVLVRETLGSRVREDATFDDVDDWLDRLDLMDDCEGDELKGARVGASFSTVSSVGSSLTSLRGLSRIG